MTSQLTDLASEAVGGAVVVANDEFFAAAANLLKHAEPEWRQGVFTDRGKWMDGWETRRRRTPGHDWCIVRLGIAGEVGRVVVDTTHFRGNHPEAVSIEGCGVGRDERLDEAVWEELVPRSPLQGDARNALDVANGRRATHLRINIFPDGGVARLRVEGVPLPGLGEVAPEGAYPDLASTVLGGAVAGASDDFFGSAQSLLRPGPSRGMFDGWETRRRRGAGNDWVTVRLGLSGIPRRVLVDTTHFKGNAPGAVAVAASADGEQWEEIVPRRPVAPHREHLFEVERPLEAAMVRLDIFPDGGVARLRVFGEPTRAVLEGIRIRYLNALFEQEATRFFRTACGSPRWVEHMLAARPYPSGDAVLEHAGAVFSRLDEGDWKEAFAAHPRIGEKGEGFSRGEQAAATATMAGRHADMAEANSRYEERFGHGFIIAAAGRSTDEILADLGERMGNDPAGELVIAAAEQRRITELRLRQMLCLGETE